MSEKLKIIHIINSFQFGGAEAMLCNLVLRTDAERFDSSVVSLIDDMTVAGPLISAGVRIDIMGMSPGIPDPRAIVRLARHLRRERPDVIQTWMDHSNLIGGVAARLGRSAPVVWGVHHSDHVAGLTKRSTLMTVGACAMLSKYVPAKIVYCSQHARKLYGARGFAGDMAMVIPNGFDTSRFSPDPQARIDVRRELGLGPDAPLIGLAARFDPLKDHATFIRAAAALAKVRPDAHFLLCGAKVDRENIELTTLIDSLNLRERCHLIGPRRDVPRILSALDILASSSISEAFPLTVGEAMACGVPSVATDVGDSALIVGDTGKIVPPREADIMAGAWAEVLGLAPDAKRRLGESARKRVRELFDLDAVTRRYEAVYESVAKKKLIPAPAPVVQACAA